MPTWGDLLVELQRPENAQPNGQPNFDKVRRGYLAKLAALTGRPVIVYATAFLDRPEIPSGLIQIELGDLQGFMNVVAGIEGRELDLLITSPGGSAEATESLVSYLRTKFDHIRAIIPIAAMSAATMLALGADEIVMGRHSQLGPIDPQFTIFTPEGPRSSPAFEILRQFQQAKDECRDPNNLPAWLPILRTYAPGLLAQCVTQRELAERMVAQWLESYMLRGTSDAKAVASAAAAWFADYERFASHARRVSLPDVQSLGLKASSLEEDQALQDAVLSVHHACSHTFSGTGAVKLIENHLGKSFVKVRQQVITVQPASDPGSTLPPRPAPNSRAERRRQGGR